MQQQQFPKEGYEDWVRFIYTFTQTHPVKLLLSCLYWTVVTHMKGFYMRMSEQWYKSKFRKVIYSNHIFKPTTKYFNTVKKLAGSSGPVFTHLQTHRKYNCFSLSNLNFWLRLRLHQNLFLAESLVIPKCSQTFPGNWISLWELENKIQMRENSDIKFACRANKHFD